MNKKNVTLGAMLVLLCGASTAALAQALPDSSHASASASASANSDSDSDSDSEESAVRVPLDHYLKLTRPDYMSLLKVGGEWKIVNKTLCTAKNWIELAESQNTRLLRKSSPALKTKRGLS